MIRSITYNILHKHLGHPSKEVIKHAKKHTKSLPDVKIPKEDSICNGCAKDKLSNRSFPSTERCATHTFELIHSDIKSFPIESYHQYKYIITFFDDYTSMVWVTALHTKDAALTATRYFLKMVSMQFGAKIQG